jgi:hypothetical protein
VKYSEILSKELVFGDIATSWIASPNIFPYFSTGFPHKSID